MQRGAQHAKTVANARAAIGILTDNARRIAPVTATSRSPVAMRGARPDDPDGRTRPRQTPMQGALVQAFQGLAQHGAGKVDPYLMGKIEPSAGRSGSTGSPPSTSTN